MASPSIPVNPYGVDPSIYAASMQANPYTLPPITPAKSFPVIPVVIASVVVVVVVIGVVLFIILRKSPNALSSASNTSLGSKSPSSSTSPGKVLDFPISEEQYYIRHVATQKWLRVDDATLSGATVNAMKWLFTLKPQSNLPSNEKMYLISNNNKRISVIEEGEPVATLVDQETYQKWHVIRNNAGTAFYLRDDAYNTYLTCDANGTVSLTGDGNASTTPPVGAAWTITI
jgi:hypothetical protein